MLNKLLFSEPKSNYNILCNNLEKIINKLNETKEDLAEAAHDASDNAQNILAKSLNGIKDKSWELEEDVEHYIQAKPIKSIGIALVIGLFVGFISRGH